MGAPRSHHAGGSRGDPGPHRHGRPRAVRTARSGEGPPARCSGSSTPRTSTSAPGTTTSASRRPPSASASSRPSRRRSTSPSPRRSISFLIAGDLFDSNVQPRRSVERVAAELKRLAEARIRTRHHPGHPRLLRPRVDLPRLRPRGDGRQRAGRRHGHRPRSRPPVGPPGRARRGRPRPGVRHEARAAQPAQGLSAASAEPRRRRDRPAATWQIGMVHGSIAIPGKTEHDEVVITTDEIAASGLDYLALGHWHSTQTGKAGGVTYAYAGAPEAVALDQDRPGKVLLVELDERAGTRAVTIAERRGRPDAVRQGRDRRGDGGQPAGPGRRSSRHAPTPTSSSTSGSSGVRRDDLDLDLDEIETALAPSFLKVRVRDASVPALTEGPLPVARHDRRRVHPRPRGTDRRARGGRARPPRRPSSATRSGSGGCCSPASEVSL